MKLPLVYTDKNGNVRCPYCTGIHRHGGMGNGIASGERFADCAKGEYIVIPYHQHDKDDCLKKLSPPTRDIMDIQDDINLMLSKIKERKQVKTN